MKRTRLLVSLARSQAPQRRVRILQTLPAPKAASGSRPRTTALPIGTVGDGTTEHISGGRPPTAKCRGIQRRSSWLPRYACGPVASLQASVSHSNDAVDKCIAEDEFRRAHRRFTTDFSIGILGDLRKAWRREALPRSWLFQRRHFGKDATGADRKAPCASAPDEAKTEDAEMHKQRRDAPDETAVPWYHQLYTVPNMLTFLRMGLTPWLCAMIVEESVRLRRV